MVSISMTSSSKRPLLLLLSSLLVLLLAMSIGVAAHGMTVTVLDVDAKGDDIYSVRVFMGANIDDDATTGETLAEAERYKSPIPRSALLSPSADYRMLSVDIFSPDFAYYAHVDPESTVGYSYPEDGVFMFDFEATRPGDYFLGVRVLVNMTLVPGASPGVVEDFQTGGNFTITGTVATARDPPPMCIGRAFSGYNEQVCYTFCLSLSLVYTHT
jgi:hypothetical protein